ncbi:MAG: hypothetical protein J6Q61_02765 [Bacteroidales bacterium]|nr:hypothetical protein [Bacteroidales bacterium]MBO5853639.1 hypothetical protein [Bacteroidales bacterium]
MTVIRKTLSFRPIIWKMISNEAKLRDVNISRCIEDKFEFCDNEDYTYTMEELEEGLKQARKDDAEGKLLTFNSPSESLAYILEHED